ncbi:GNAT family N-acetyltransferase [Agrococcus sp. SGAir0287]|uniref:GNAT family N-acetyltransferase n=1 Tax=Agrococcus sp. SGAir0287 TaxID=2070347 RepID=UPI001586B4DB|nr:GNAT family N-acetyltransferase [Agrococcus sp. SGAir0287]
MADTTVRTATVDDARAISVVQVETWRAAYAALMPEALLRRMDVERSTARRTETWAQRHRDPRVADLVAERDGEVVGWACVGPTDQDDLPAHGQLFAIYALEHAWSSGVGHALMAEAETRLRDAGFERACLYVLDGNHRAAAFYERHDWREDGRTWIDERFGYDGVLVPLLERRRVRDLGEDA